MSRYGPDDDHPGRPGRHHTGPDEPYGPSSDPWGPRRDPWTDLTVPQPGYRDDPPGQGYAPPGHGYAPPGARHRGPPGGHPVRRQPPRRGRRGLRVAVLVVLVLLVVGGVAATVYWLGGDSSPGAGPATDPSPGGSSTASPAGGGEDDGDGAQEAPPDRIGMGATVAQQGDCLVNDGTTGQPEMRIVSCDTDEETRVYRVLARFDEQVSGDSPQEQDQSAQEICAGTEGYTHHYRFVAPDPEESFVLCMEEP